MAMAFETYNIYDALKPVYFVSKYGGVWPISGSKISIPFAIYSVILACVLSWCSLNHWLSIHGKNNYMRNVNIVGYVATFLILLLCLMFIMLNTNKIMDCINMINDIDLKFKKIGLSVKYTCFVFVNGMVFKYLIFFGVYLFDSSIFSDDGLVQKLIFFTNSTPIFVLDLSLRFFQTMLYYVKSHIIVLRNSFNGRSVHKIEDILNLYNLILDFVQCLNDCFAFNLLFMMMPLFVNTSHSMLRCIWITKRVIYNQDFKKFKNVLSSIFYYAVWIWNLWDFTRPAQLCKNEGQKFTTAVYTAATKDKTHIFKSNMIAAVFTYMIVLMNINDENMFDND